MSGEEEKPPPERLLSVWIPFLKASLFHPVLLSFPVGLLCSLSLSVIVVLGMYLSQQLFGGYCPVLDAPLM